jgi:large subunit ribosomal protein L30
MPKKAGASGAAKQASRGKRAASAGKRTPKAASPAAAAGATLRVKQVRSGIGHAATYRRTLAALGLKYHQDEVVVRDHPSVRGMLRKVAHLVRVETVEA